MRSPGPCPQRGGGPRSNSLVDHQARSRNTVLFLTRSLEAARFQVDRLAVELFLCRDASEFPKVASRPSRSQRSYFTTSPPLEKARSPMTFRDRTVLEESFSSQTRKARRTGSTDFLGGNAGVVNCGLSMNKPFDVEIERLTAPGSESIRPLLGLAQAPERGTFFLETFGCQMNDHDSEKVAGVLLARGYRQVGTADAAGLILYNTCSIREKAAQKVFSRLGEYRAKQSEGKIIGVLGCVAQQEGEGIFERAPWVSLVCGSASYRKLPELIAQLESGNHRVTGLELDTDETFETEITRRDNPFRAYLTIIEGCDKACSYCVVPYTRGPERSRASDSILREVRQLAELGYSEIQLLGQTVNSYKDPTPRKMRFAELLLAVAGVPGVRRVRFTTSHPSDFTKDIVEAMEAQPKICEHVHLPVQSGSTRVLRAMQRTYTREE